MIRLAILVVLATGLLGCESSKCKDYAEKQIRECVKNATQQVLVDGKPIGPLTPPAEAEKSCSAHRDQAVAWCKDAPDELFKCDLVNYAGTEAEWKKDQRCQELLGADWKRRHPKE